MWLHSQQRQLMGLHRALATPFERNQAHTTKLAAVFVLMASTQQQQRCRNTMAQCNHSLMLQFRGLCLKGLALLERSSCTPCDSKEHDKPACTFRYMKLSGSMLQAKPLLPISSMGCSSRSVLRQDSAHRMMKWPRMRNQSIMLWR